MTTIPRMPANVSLIFSDAHAKSGTTFVAEIASDNSDLPQKVEYTALLPAQTGEAIKGYEARGAKVVWTGEGNRILSTAIVDENYMPYASPS